MVASWASPQVFASSPHPGHLLPQLLHPRRPSWQHLLRLSVASSYPVRARRCHLPPFCPFSCYDLTGPAAPSRSRNTRGRMFLDLAGSARGCGIILSWNRLYS